MAPTPGRTALVVVDMQNAFCRDEGSTALIGLDAARLKAAVAPCRRLLEGARASGLPVIFTRYAYRPDYADGGILVRYLVPALGRADHLAAGSWDAALLDEFAPRPTEVVVDKNRPSAFYAPAMEAALARLDVDTLVVCGVTTSCCVESTVRDASQRDYKVFVARRHRRPPRRGPGPARRPRVGRRHPGRPAGPRERRQRGVSRSRSRALTTLPALFFGMSAIAKNPRGTL